MDVQEDDVDMIVVSFSMMMTMIVAIARFKVEGVKWIWSRHDCIRWIGKWIQQFVDVLVSTWSLLERLGDDMMKRMVVITVLSILLTIIMMKWMIYSYIGILMMVWLQVMSIIHSWGRMKIEQQGWYARQKRAIGTIIQRWWSEKDKRIKSTLICCDDELWWSYWRWCGQWVCKLDRSIHYL